MLAPLIQTAGYPSGPRPYHPFLFNLLNSLSHTEYIYISLLPQTSTTLLSHFVMTSNLPEMAAADSDHLRGAFSRLSPSTDSCSNQRKRKADQIQNPKEYKMTVQNSKSKSSTVTSNNNSGTSEPPKTDFIHVRARRGQATDSHSLAERVTDTSLSNHFNPPLHYFFINWPGLAWPGDAWQVRREKISQRMKYLQDLVPGCNRITGKAGMLDEIINYVQSLQRQVEFLSMKLAAVNPTLDDYLTKEMFPACLPTVGPASHMVNPANVQVNTLDQGVSGPSLEMGVNSIDIAFKRAINAPVSIPDAFLDSCLNQIQHLAWEDELQNLYNMEFLQGRSSTHTLPASVGFPNQV